MASARLDSSRLTRRLHLHDELALPQPCSRTAARVVVFGSPPASDFKAVSLAPSGVGKLVSPSLRAYYLFFRSVLFAPVLWRHRLAPCLVASLTSARSSVDCLSFGWVVSD
ncbi:unnamed protein product [Arabidopsis halleri]